MPMRLRHLIAAGRRLGCRHGLALPHSRLWIKWGPETANDIHAVISRTVRPTIDAQADEFHARGDALVVALWHCHVLRGVEDVTRADHGQV
jgi:hypothetical protein